ncbi:hypothetical protein NE237_027231 [Protea cynaroides]|uniref:Uncharacterized protein n=1 Tax=Protea cynaroides TaxID=273540 RepID=A0A9Q0GN63_9MAGN|nr:hypothetical protein NE237_027231 [Protea cynaroides]
MKACRELKISTALSPEIQSLYLKGGEEDLETRGEEDLETRGEEEHAEKKTRGEEELAEKKTRGEEELAEKKTRGEEDTWEEIVEKPIGGEVKLDKKLMPPQKPYSFFQHLSCCKSKVRSETGLSFATTDLQMLPLPFPLMFAISLFSLHGLPRFTTLRPMPLRRTIPTTMSIKGQC